MVLTRLLFQIVCVTVMQWTSTCLYMQMNRVPRPATLFYVSLYRFFFCLVFVFNTFPLWLVIFILTADPADHALGSPVTYGRNLNSCVLYIVLIINIFTLKSPLGVPQKIVKRNLLLGFNYRELQVYAQYSIKMR